jgi:hypothetical protein
MGKVISKFLVEMYNGRPTIKMLDRSSSQTESVVVIESDSLADNVKQILSYVYDECRGFYEGYAPVRHGKHWGYVDVTLNEVVTPFYDYAFSVQEGFALVEEGNKYKFLKMSDSCVPIPYNRSDFDGASSFCNGMARVERDGLHGYISNTNHLMEEIPCQYEAAFDFDLKHPYAVVMIHGKYGMIDKSGDEVVPPLFDTYTPRVRSSGSLCYNATIGDKLYMLKADGTYKEVVSK